MDEALKLFRPSKRNLAEAIITKTIQRLKDEQKQLHERYRELFSEREVIHQEIVAAAGASITAEQEAAAIAEFTAKVRFIRSTTRDSVTIIGGKPHLRVFYQGIDDIGSIDVEIVYPPRYFELGKMMKELDDQKVAINSEINVINTEPHAVGAILAHPELLDLVAVAADNIYKAIKGDKQDKQDQPATEASD